MLHTSVRARAVPLCSLPSLILPPLPIPSISPSTLFTAPAPQLLYLCRRVCASRAFPCDQNSSRPLLDCSSLRSLIRFKKIHFLPFDFSFFHGVHFTIKACACMYAYIQVLEAVETCKTRVHLDACGSISYENLQRECERELV